MRTGPYGFTLPICERMNTFTGEWLPVSPPVQIHTDDLDWLERLREDTDRLDYEIRRAS